MPVNDSERVNERRCQVSICVGLSKIPHDGQDGKVGVGLGVRIDKCLRLVLDLS